MASDNKWGLDTAHVLTTDNLARVSRAALERDYISILNRAFGSKEPGRCSRHPTE